MKCSLGVVLGGGICPPAVEADEFSEAFLFRLFSSFPAQPGMSSASWDVPPGSWTLGELKDGKILGNAFLLVEAPWEPLSHSPCCQWHLRKPPDLSDPPLPGWLLGFPCGVGTSRVLPTTSFS